jgi:hypothetical protein
MNPMFRLPAQHGNLRFHADQGGAQVIGSSL